MKPWMRSLNIFLMGFLVGGMTVSLAIGALEARQHKKLEGIRHYDPTGPYDATWCDYFMYDRNSDSYRCADQYGKEKLTQRTWTEIPTEPPRRRWVSP
jgi:hypothetical protein